MRTDVNACIGRYPWRDIGATPEELGAALDRVGVTEAWVSLLDSIFWRNPAAGNDALIHACAARPGWRPVGAIHPGLPGWQMELDRLAACGSPTVRCDPTRYGISAHGTEMIDLVAACAEREMPIQLAIRLEDGRQRHPNDVAPDIQPASLRHLLRSHPTARFVVTQADRECIEQVHFGSTATEAERILWDISWIWGPPEDHLELLTETVGIERFAFGSGAPLRLVENSAVKIELLQLDDHGQALINAGNAARFAHRP